MRGQEDVDGYLMMTRKRRRWQSFDDDVVEMTLTAKRRWLIRIIKWNHVSAHAVGFRSERAFGSDDPPRRRYSKRSRLRRGAQRQGLRRCNFISPCTNLRLSRCGSILLVIEVSDSVSHRMLHSLVEYIKTHPHYLGWNSTMIYLFPTLSYAGLRHVWQIAQHNKMTTLPAIWPTMDATENLSRTIFLFVPPNQHFIDTVSNIRSSFSTS